MPPLQAGESRKPAIESEHFLLVFVGHFDALPSVDLILNYQRACVGAALPWHHERHAVREVWAKLTNDIGPRDSGRGIRSGF
jgi:hypothetical protein